MNSFAERYAFYKSQIPETTQLLPVSKTQSEAVILNAYHAGCKNFGENYVQELHQKQARLPQDICWHFIGHLQRNKVSRILPYTYLIHSLDRIELAVEIEKQAAKINKIQSVLIQLHIATESSKFGFSDSELLQFLNNYNPAVFPHLKIKGIMAMASLTQNMEQIEREFQHAQQTFHQLKLRIPEAEILSMGMSSDFPLAIKHGSTLIRMGTALFGSRTQST